MMRCRVAHAIAAAAVSMFAGAATSQPQIVTVAPSGATVPERLLRISVTFSAPQFEGLAAPATLLRADGSVITDALIDQQLWSPDRRTATFLFDPGRVKTGLIAHQKSGPVLHPGELVELRISGKVVHRWTVVAGGCVVPDLDSWTVAVPQAGSRVALWLDFPGPIDALSRDLIAVADTAGHRIGGSALLTDGERRWSFVPDAPWSHGTLQIVVHPRLESPCGDEPGEPFEHAAGQGLGLQREAPNRTVTIN